MPDDYSDSELAQMVRGSESPAAPAGLQQTLAAGGNQEQSQYAGSKLAQWVTSDDQGRPGATQAAQSWFTGANLASPMNGWSNDFVDTFQAQYDAAAEEGTLINFFDRDGATGVVTYDQVSKDDPEKVYSFGDIYENGELKGNVYDLYDRDTANLMLSAFMLSADEQKDAFKTAKAGEVPEGTLRAPDLDKAITEKRDWNEANLARALSAQAFEADVTRTEKEFTEGAVDEAIVAGGAAGGAVTGAGAGAVIGSVVPGAGTAVGATAGAIIGGSAGFVGALLNKDALTEQAARAKEITDLAEEQFNSAAAFSTGVHQWSKFGMRLISPGSNLVQGTVDWAGKSEIGDGEADFYKVDAKGERTTSKLAIGADVAASVGDGLLQFASPVGLATYSTLMTGTIAGESGQLGFSGGNMFDDRSGSFDNIFVDENGQFDKGSAAAGIGTIGIDVVQLGFARGLAQKVNAGRGAVGQEAAFATAPGALGRQTTGRLPKWLGGSTNKAAAREALEEGGEEVVIGGMAYTLNASGQAVSRRASLSMLAPSEVLTGLSAKVMARRHLARAEGAISTDDIYRTAQAMASGEMKLQTAMVNAMGEGSEEALQAVLEPISHDADIDMEQVYMSAAYGAAGGLGMGLGANLSLPSQREILEAQASQAHFLMTSGGQLGSDTLKSMTDDELRRLAATMTTAQREVSSTAAKKAVDSLTADNVAGVAGEAKLIDAIRTNRDSELAKATARTDAAFVITPLESAGKVDKDGNLAFGSIPSDGIASSARQMLKNFDDRFKGFTIQAEQLEAEAARLAAGDQSDPDTAASFAKVTQDAATARAVVDMANRVGPRLLAAVRKIDTEQDMAVKSADVAELNHQLRLWFAEADDDFFGEPLTADEKRYLARAVSMVWARDPHDSAGSYPVLVPQVSLQLTAHQADNVMQVSSGILKAIRGDHDGDKLRPLNQLWLDDDAYTSARSGAWYIGTGSAVHVDPPKQEKYLVEYLSRSLDSSAYQPLQAVALDTLTTIGTAIKRRYAGLGVDSAIDKVNQAFYDAVKANTKDARGVLLDGLAKHIGGPLSDFSRRSMTNEWLWLDQLIRSNLQTFQEKYVAFEGLPAREQAEVGEPERYRKVALSRSVRERRARRSSTFGNTMALWLVGDSPFRMFQKLHYSSIQSPVLSAANVEPMDLREMSEYYEQLGQLVVQSELDRVRGVDDITAGVQNALEALAADAEAQTALAANDPTLNTDGNLRRLSKAEALVVIANTAVQDFNYNPETQQYTAGGTISMAQMLLKLAVQRDQREKHDILLASPSLQAKHARLLEVTRPGGGRENSGVNAEKAFVEVFGSQSMASLLGEEAELFGPQITLEQFIRSYAAKSEVERRQVKQALTLDNPAYLGRKRNKNVPYDLNEVVQDEVTPFRSVVDSILAVGNARDSEYAERSQVVGKQFHDMHTSVRSAMRTMLQLSPKSDELPVELVQRVIEENPDFARRVFELIPNNMAAVTLPVIDGKVHVNNWFLEMFAEKSAKKAEMIYWRASLIESWQALDIRTGEDDASGREYDRLRRRMHRVMYRVAPSKAKDAGLLMKTFQDALWAADDVEKFIDWVNKTPGMRAEHEAPLVAWFDDVAEFDVDKANGGWTTSLAGAELREAIKLLQQQSGALASALVEEVALKKQDDRYLRAIDRVVNGANPSEEDQDVYRSMEEAIKRAGELAVSLGPNAMVFQTVANAWGFYGQAHTKGKNPAHVEAYGMFDARRDAFGFLHNYSRVMGALTAVDIDAVGNNLNLVAKDAGRTMDDYGNIVEWGKPTVEQMADLLRDPKTRPFARAMLFPTVLERNDEGQMSEKMLFGKSMQELLEGSSYDELFPQFGPGTLKRDAAFKYLTLVESMSRKFGGHMSVSRAVNDLVIARLQAAKQELTFDQVEDMVLDAYYEVANVLQTTGSLAAAENVTHTTRLDELRLAAKKDRREEHLRSRLGVDADTYSIIKTDLETQHMEDVNALLEQARTNPLREAEILTRIDRLQTDHDEWLAHVAALEEGDEVGVAVAAFAMPTREGLTPEEYEHRAAMVQRKIVEYIDLHPAIRERVPGASVEIGRIQFQLSDPDNYGEVTISDADWDTVSRAIIGTVLTDSAGPVGAGASVRLFPGEKNIGDARYYDQSFSYLIDPLMDPKSPAVQAAAQLHLMAKRHEDIAEDDEIIRAIDTVFDTRKLGPWTPEVVVASVEANQRIDSAAAAPAVAISGSSPKLEATVSAATERTFEMPGDELLSTVTLTPADLERSLFDEVDIVFPGGQVDQRPLAQLNNRFAKQVVMTLGDGTQVDLLQENADLGRYWRGNANSARPELGVPVEIHLDRLAEAMTASAARRGASVGDASVQVSFFHPESQPASPEFYNNLWFEGTSFALDADRHASLNETLWFALGSLSPEGQAAALDAAKTGKAAMQVIVAPSAADRAADETDWQTDLARVLRRKTQRILDTDLGFGKLDVEFYNAVNKGVKLRHFVLQNGEVFTAEQVIESQRAGNSFEDAILWTPSDTVLRSMLGEQGDEGVQRLFDDQLDFDNNRIPRYRGVSDEMKRRFSEGLTGGTRNLADTRIANRGRQTALNVRTMLPRKIRDQFVENFRRLSEVRNFEIIERTSRMSGPDGFNPRTNLQSALDRATDAFQAENLAFAFRALGINYIGPRKTEDTLASELVIRELKNLENADGKKTGWVLRNGAQADFVSGLLGHVPDFNEAPKGLRIVLGDIVVMELDSYGDGPEGSKLAMKAIDKLAGLGATIVLSDPTGGSDLRGELAAYVRSSGYRKLAGSKHVYVPLEMSSEYTVQQAREDTLTEVRGISRTGRALVFNAVGVPMQEGGAWRNPRKTNIGNMKVVSDLLPLSSMGGFGLPQRTNVVDDQVDRVIRHLRGLDNPVTVEALKKMSKSENDPTFDRAWRRMIQRFDNPENGVLPTYDDGFEIGDMIPLVDNQNRLLIYRHGNKRPSRAEMKAMHRTALPNRERGGANVAMYFSEAEPAATAHSGKPVEFKERAGYGLSVELEVPLQDFGDKLQLEYDGTKYTVVPWPDADQPGSPVLPEHTPFETLDVALVSDYDTRAGKEGFDSVVNNHRTAFALFGIDFLGDVTEFFFPGQANDLAARQSTRGILRFFSNVVEKIDVGLAHDMVNQPTLHTEFESLLPQVSEFLQTEHGIDGNWVTRLDTLGTVEQQITTAMLLYLATPGARPEDVLSSGSLDDLSAGPDGQARLMPRLFTQVFDNARLGSPLRVEMNRRLNASLNNKAARPGQSYRLLENFDFIVDSGQPGKKMTGFLSFPEIHSSGDNPVTNGQSFREGSNQQVSQHSVIVADQAIGARSFASKLKGKAQEFKDVALGTSDKVARFTPGVYDDGGVWKMLSDVPATDHTYDAWSAPLPAELERRGIAYDAMVGFRQAIDRTSEHISEAEEKLYDEHVRYILDHLNLPQTLSGLVDGWVRQMSGRPAGMMLDGVEVEPLTGKAMVEYARWIRDNVSDGFLPTMGGYVPLLHVHDLQVIKRSQQGAARPWAPRMGVGDTGNPAGSWDEWVDSAIGSALASDVKFQRIYLLPVDGFMHTYQNATRDLSALPVSVDALVTRQVLSLPTNELLETVTETEVMLEEAEVTRIESVDPRVARMMASPVVLDTAKATLTDLLNGQRIAGEFRGEAAPASAKAKQDAHIRRHRKQAGLPTPVAVSMKDFRKNSVEFRYHTTTSNALVRGLMNLRVGTALLNPALYVSMPIELMVRGSLDRVSNIITGTNTTGLRAAQLSQALGNAGKIGDVAQAAGLQTLLNPEQVRKVRDMIGSLGTSPEFKALIYRDLNYIAPVEEGQSKIGRGLAAYAKAGSRIQDPTWGMRGDALARRYFEGALSHIVRSGTLTGIGIDQLIDQLSVNPTYLENSYPEASKAGSNTIAQIRSIKDTPVSLALRWLYEPMSQNPNSPMLNMFGNLVLRMPMMFSGYAANVATTILGLQGVSDMTAAFLDGKKKGPGHIFGRISAKMRGDEFNPDIDAEFDMSSVLEGVDLARSFLRGSLTHTGLFTFAMMAGGLGLSGEDDEMKRRRRAAELQGGGVLYDPRKIENDFRNADAIFLDWLPFGWDSYFTDPETGRAMAQTHWMLKQFISPIVGIEKFMETGNFNHVKWGFMDALGSFPLINSNMISDVMETQALFEKQAADLALEGTDEANVKAAGLLTQVVGSYEKMLFENAFLSALYVGMDDYDRDPYAQVLIDSDGTIQVDGLGEPRQTTRLGQAIDPDTGLPMTTYLSRPDNKAALSVLTENRPTLALMTSLFSGLGDSEYWRYNMVPKIREIEKPTVTNPMAQAYILAAFRGQSTMRNLSVDEALDQIKAEYRERGEWYDGEESIMPEARARSAASGGAALSLMTEAGEQLTEEGAKEIFRSLRRGSITLEDPELQRLYIPYDMRKQIVDDWTKEIIAEGVTMGLSQSDAVSRSKRLMYGPYGQSDVVGLADLMFSKEIPAEKNAKYYQLNTTYVMGPDGRPWATGWRRDGAKGATGVFGSVLGLSGVMPLKRQIGAGKGMGTDERGNTVDLVNGLNTGLRSLVAMPESPPTDEEIGKMIAEAIENAAKQDYSAFAPYAQRSNGGYGYRRSGYTPYKRRSYGSGGGYSSSGYPNFTRMYSLPKLQSPYSNDIPFINTSNPILRRADVRRERVWSERGRLNQWQ